jgi:Leucine-rich repeat (LRR) protein
MDIGTKVRVTGLQNAAQYNGKIGRIITLNGDRVGVKLDDDKTEISVRPANLAMVFAPSFHSFSPSPSSRASSSPTRRLFDCLTEKDLEDLEKVDKLELGHNNIDDLDGIQLLNSLKHLDLQHNKIVCLAPYKFHKKLTHLNLSDNLIQSLRQCHYKGRQYDVNLPKNLKALHVDNNKITSLEGVTFPPELEALTLHGNPITSLDRVVLPNSLKVLFLDTEQVTSLTDFQLPMSLIRNLKPFPPDVLKKYDIIEKNFGMAKYVLKQQQSPSPPSPSPEALALAVAAEKEGFVKDARVKVHNLPEKLQMYNEKVGSIIRVFADENKVGVRFEDDKKMLKLNFDIVEFLPMGVFMYVPEDKVVTTENLELVDKHTINVLDGLESMIALKHLNLSGNRIVLLAPRILPNTLLTMNLSRNLIVSLLGDDVFPIHLQVLILNGNQIKSIAGVNFPSGLKILELCNNPIASIRKAFIPVTTLIEGGFRISLPISRHEHKPDHFRRQLLRLLEPVISDRDIYFEAAKIVSGSAFDKTQTPLTLEEISAFIPSFKAAEKACSVCGKIPANERCMGCEESYCSKDCQECDWPTHEQICIERRYQEYLRTIQTADGGNKSKTRRRRRQSKRNNLQRKNKYSRRRRRNVKSKSK